MKQWRWSLIDPVTKKQESGQRLYLREAMSDVASTEEHMIERHEYEGQD